MNHVLRAAARSLLLVGSIVPVYAVASGDPAKSLFGWSDPAQSQIAPAAAGATIESPPTSAAEPTPTATNEVPDAAATESTSTTEATEVLAAPAVAPGGQDEAVATMATPPETAAAPSSDAGQSPTPEVRVVEITAPAAATATSSNVAAPSSVAIEEVTQEVTEAQ